MGASRRFALALFAKAPRPGRVKTRLVPVLGARGAAAFHRRTVEAVWKRLSRVAGADLFLYCDVEWGDFRRLAGPDRFRLQVGTGLGARMRGCLEELLEGGCGKALIVGSDSPTLPARQLSEAVTRLETAEVVLGPCEDGGFTLIGATRTAPDMFRRVPWSRPDTRQACLASLRSAGLSATETETSAYDLDIPEDLDRLLRDPSAPGPLRQWLLGRLGRRSGEVVPACRPQPADHGRNFL